MKQIEQKVILLDELGEKYGKEHVFYNLKSPIEAFRLLFLNFPELQKEMAIAHEKGIAYSLVQSGVNIKEDELELPLGVEDLVVAPVFVGAGEDFDWKRGIGYLIAGAVLIVTAIFAPALLPGLAQASWFAGATTAIMGIGISLAITGVSRMMSGDPELDSGDGSSASSDSTGGARSAKRGLDGQSSYAFSAPQNIIALGSTIPLVYGECFVGSALLSSKVSAKTVDEEDIKGYLMEPGTDTVTIGGERLTSGWNSKSGVRTKRYKRSLGETPSRAYRPGEHVELSDEEWEDTHNIDKKDKGKKFDVVLALTDGLYKRVSTKKSTKIPGWITYKISVYDDIDVEDDGRGAFNTVVGQITATVQGLLETDQNFRWAHRFQYSTAGEGDRLEKFKIEIIDHGCTEEDIGKGGSRDSCNLMVQAYGNSFVN